jgi:hypothetical protein
MISECIVLLDSIVVKKEKYEQDEKNLIQEEIDTRKYAFNVGKVLPLSKAVSALLEEGNSVSDDSRSSGEAASVRHTEGERAVRNTEGERAVRNAEGERAVRNAEGEKAWPFAWRLHHKLHDMLMFGIEELRLDSCGSVKDYGRLDARAESHCTDSPIHSQDWFAKHAPLDGQWFDLDHILTCWRNADKRSKMKVAPLCQGANPDENVEDVVKFFDVLATRERHRRESGKPRKLEFLVDEKSQGQLELHRLLGSGFGGKIKVKCSPMDQSLRGSYNRKISSIVELRSKNKLKLKETNSHLSSLCLFLFTLARGKMQSQLDAFDPEVVATSSLGIIKTFKNLISESVLEAELNAYHSFGMTFAKMREALSLCKEQSLKSDKYIERHLVQSSFRKLAQKSFGLANIDADDVKWLLQPFQNLKKTQKDARHHSNTETEPSASDDNSFSVATVILL